MQSEKLDMDAFYMISTCIARIWIYLVKFEPLASFFMMNHSSCHERNQRPPAHARPMFITILTRLDKPLTYIYIWNASIWQGIYMTLEASRMLISLCNLQNVLSSRGFVKISTNWFSERTPQSDISFLATWSLRKWWWISMCFVRECWTGLLAIFKALSLSQRSGILSNTTPNFGSKQCKNEYLPKGEQLWFKRRRKEEENREKQRRIIVLGGGQVIIGW